MSEDYNLCTACLSKDRKLVIISIIRPLIVYLNIKELTKSEGSICWECYTAIMRFNRFRCKVREVQEILAKGSKHTKSYSPLGITKINHYDYLFEYKEPKIHENGITEAVLVKHELDIESDNKETIFSDVIKCEKKKMLPNKRMSTKRMAKNKQLKDVKNKTSRDFQMVLLSEDRLATKQLTDTKNDFPDEFLTDILPQERCTEKDNSKNKTNEFEITATTKRFLPRRLSTKRSKLKPDLLPEFKKAVAPKEKLKAKSLLKAKRSKLTPDLANKFEMVKLTDEEVSKSREEKRNHHNYKKLPYKCDYCVLGFTKKEYYDYHMAAKHDEAKGEPCDVCSVRFTNLIVLHNHRSLHYQYFRCKLCEYKGSTHMAVVNHVTEKHKYDTTDNIHCKLCSKCCRSPEEMSEHMRADHTLYCNECGEKFKTKGSLRLHLKRVHTVKREFVCGDCKKTFVTRSRLESHLARHSTSLARRLAYCAVCRVQYKDLAVYRSHLRNSLNHVQDKFPCPDCDKKFASKAYWKKHFNFYHLKKSQHKCEECNKIFMSSFLLKGHRQKYHGLSRPRNHLCDICQKRFYTAPQLRAHAQIHSAQRAYMCASCGDTFKQRPALYTHQRLLHAQIVT